MKQVTPSARLGSCLLMCAVALGAVACGRQRAPSDAEAVTFERACREPSQRAAYLAAVAERVRLPDYVERVDYLDDQAARELLGDPAQRPHPGLATVAADPSDRRPVYQGGRRSRLVVLPSAFDCDLEANTGEIVLMLGLLDHELVHARQAQLGLASLPTAELRDLPPDTAARLYDAVAELEAYRNELAQAASYRLPADYYRVAVAAYLEHYLRLFDVRLAVTASLRDRLLIHFFERWMFDQARVFVRDGDQWRFEVEGAVYRFPASVVRALSTRDRDAGVE